MSENKKVTVTVRGSVQGIGYRWYVQGLARSKNLGGWVKNRYDGAVEIQAEGAKASLEEFLVSLRKHPYARISSVETDWMDQAKKEFDDFEIRF